jgi:hypothetical protein
MNDINYGFQDLHGGAGRLAETGVHLSEAANSVNQVALSALSAGSPVAAEAVRRFADEWHRLASAGSLNGTGWAAGTFRAAQGLDETVAKATREQRRHSTELSGNVAVRNLGA